MTFFCNTWIRNFVMNTCLLISLFVQKSHLNNHTMWCFYVSSNNNIAPCGLFCSMSELDIILQFNVDHLQMFYFVASDQQGLFRTHTWSQDWFVWWCYLQCFWKTNGCFTKSTYFNFTTMKKENISVKNAYRINKLCPHHRKIVRVWYQWINKNINNWGQNQPRYFCNSLVRLIQFASI